MSIMLPAKKVLYNLGSIHRIPLGEGRTFRVAGDMVAVFRARSGAVFATQASCPHKGGSLADGILGGNTVVCPLHAYKFNLANGESVGNTCAALRTYPVSVSDGGDILLTVEEA
jgi:nitrite reductase (NADH) small subunit